jgi:2-methylcitrate dehydratase
MKDNSSKKTTPKTTRLGRRDFMKMSAGAGLAITALNSPLASAQETSRIAAQNRTTGPAYNPAAWTERERFAGVKMETTYGWKNTSGRASGNGPMDDTSRLIVEYVTGFTEADLTPKLIDAFNNTMVDTIASHMSGFESEPARICARLARTTQSDLKSTVLGYGITTTPELAAYANSSMIRHTDFNDHNSDMIGGVLAIAEAVHATGLETIVATVLAYQVDQALGAAGGNSEGLDAGLYYTAGVAAGVGKLLKLNQDQLANAISLALSLHIPLRVDRSNTLSMQKGCSTADSARIGVYCTLAAREGMTGPSKPFEGRDGLWDRLTGPYKQLRLPPPPLTTVGLTGFIKRRPAEGYTQATHADILPAVRAWVKPDDIASIHIEMSYSGWLEIADPPKFDPLNRETADHSMPYEVARALLDGDVYVDSFTHEKYTDPKAHAIMQKITVSANPEYAYGQTKMTVRNKAGAELVKETEKRIGLNAGIPMTPEDIVAKYHRIADFIHVAPDQRDRALAQWSNLKSVKDIAEAVQTLAKFGRPQAL